MPKYPDVHVQLTDLDGNAFAILGAVKKALWKAGHVSAGEEYFNEATTGDYNHLLQTTMKWVDVS